MEIEEQYRHALGEVERLASEDPDADPTEGERLQFLAKLLEDYEKARFRFRKPDSE